MAVIECKPTYTKPTISGYQVLGFYFTNLNGKRINLTKVNIRKIYIRHAGRMYDLLPEAQFNYAMNSISIFVNVYQLFRKRSGVARICIEYTYKNNPEVKTYEHQYKYFTDSRGYDVEKRLQRKQGGRRRKR